MKSLCKNKRGGVVTDLVSGTGGLVITVIIVFVVISTLLGANLLTEASKEDYMARNLSLNLTRGVGEVATKIPTILLIAGVVLLFGVIVILWQQAQRMGIGRGGGL